MKITALAKLTPFLSTLSQAGVIYLPRSAIVKYLDIASLPLNLMAKNQRLSPIMR